jgi:hypothetical protein
LHHLKRHLKEEEMKRSRRLMLTTVAALSVSALALSGCSTPSDSGSTSEAGGELTPIKLQLQWFAQAQFAGYYAAVDQGYYEDEGLDVTIVEGGADIVPQDALASGDVDYAISWVPKVLGSIEQGARITDVAHLRAECHDADLVQGQGHHGAGRPGRQEGGQLGLWQRVGALRRHAEGRRQPR